MNLRDLQYLVAVADHKHFGKAAQACFVSQPTLSAQLKKLEDYLGVQLIERNNRQVMVTSVGKNIVDRARLILRDVQQLQQIAKQAIDPDVGIIKLGIIPTLAPYLLPYIVPLIKKEFPKLELYLYEQQTKDILQQLREGMLDAAILAFPVEDDGFNKSHLFVEKFHLATPKQHSLAGKQSVGVDDLTNENLLLLGEGHCLRDQALSICQNIAFNNGPDFSATSLETLRQMVAAGVGVTLLPELAVKTSVINHNDIRVIPFVDPQPVRQIGMLWRNFSAQNDRLRHISDLISKHSSEFIV